VGTQLLKNMKWQAVEDDAAAEIQNFPTQELGVSKHKTHKHCKCVP
jgi:hypothetical protein